MPVTCLNARNERLISFDYTRVQWDRLKLEYLELGLYMKCCGAPAIPKTSKLNTQFFAHKSDACGEGYESAEHLLCKELVVKGARKAGWDASPEEPGQDVQGNRWIADVLCSKDRQKIAIEVQLASQTFAEYKQRTTRYENSGVGCLWLIRRPKKGHPIAVQMILDRIGSTQVKDVIGLHPDRQDMPVFQVDVKERGSIFVFFPWHHGLGPYQMPLDEFVFGALSGRMSFREGRWCWSA